MRLHLWLILRMRASGPAAEGLPLWRLARFHRLLLCCFPHGLFSPCLFPCCLCPQIIYKVYEPSDLKPVLDAVNAEQTEEKKKEQGK